MVITQEPTQSLTALHVPARRRHAETGPPKSTPKTTYARRDQKDPKPAAQISAQTAHLNSTEKYPVRWDWVVETVDIELAAHHAVIETSLLLSWIKMHRSLAPFSGPGASNRSPSLADCITTTPRFKFSVHTRASNVVRHA
jgi:hypothetical protein